jgi:hypothetical protein
MAKPVTWRTELCGNRLRQMVSPNGRWLFKAGVREKAANDWSEPEAARTEDRHFSLKTI